MFLEQMSDFGTTGYVGCFKDNSTPRRDLMNGFKNENLNV